MAKANLNNKKGDLAIITGPMFAGKTKELIRQAHLTQNDQKEILIFKNLKPTACFLGKNTKIYRNLRQNFRYKCRTSFKRIIQHLADRLTANTR